MAYFKYQSTKEINALAGAGVVTKLWQRNYYERIIRNEPPTACPATSPKYDWGSSYLGEERRGRRYIEANSANWAQDNENPVTLPP